MPRKRSVKRHAVIQPLNESYRFIPLTRNQNAIVDVEDFDWLMQWNWWAKWNACTESFYAARTINRHKALHMHAVILGCKPGQEGDHRNHDTLDNRRVNLRRATRCQNMANRRLLKSNTNGFKSVTQAWSEGKFYKRWRVRIGVNGKRIHVGYFRSIEAAARAYDEAAKKFHKEFAQVNFTED